MSGQVVIIPVKDGWTFEPESRTVKKATQTADFIASPSHVPGQYDAYGSVKDAEGNGMEGIRVIYSRGTVGLGAVRTDANGEWRIKSLTGEINVTPSRIGWEFTPSPGIVTKDNPVVHFIANEIEHDASGVILDDEKQGIANVTMTFLKDGSIVGKTTTNDRGEWTQKALMGEVVVVPSKDTYRFVPQLQTLVGDGRTADFTGLQGLFIHVDGEGEVIEKPGDSPLQVELVAEPSAGWRFMQWQIVIVEDDPADPARLIEVKKQFTKPSIVITLDGPVQVKAVFDTGRSAMTGTLRLKHSFPVSLVEEDVVNSAGLRSNSRWPGVESGLEPEFIEDQFIVRYDDFDYARQVSSLERSGYIVLDSLDILNAYLVTPKPGVQYVEPQQVAGIVSHEKNGVARLHGSPLVVIPNDELFPRQWHYNQIRLPQTWAVTTGDRNIRIAVIDTGVDPTHPELVDHLDLEHAVDLTTDNSLQDFGGHGTHVAGTIGALSNNGDLVAGTMWNVTILPVKIFDKEGRSSTWTITKGLLYSAGLTEGPRGEFNPEPVDIINMSLGGPWSKLMHDAVKELAIREIIMVASSGNESRPAVSFPAAYPEVIAVGAVGKVDKDDPDGLTEPPLAAYSNWGEALDVVAPGGNGRGIMDFVWSTATGGGFTGMAGTSMAAPHVTGVVGLMLANGINKSDVRDILHRTSMEINLPTPNLYYGHGLINAYWAVNDVREMRIIQGIREGDKVVTKTEVRIPAKGGPFILNELEYGKYQFIAWVDVNNNGIIDAGDYYAETPVLDTQLGSGWIWTGDLREVGVNGLTTEQVGQSVIHHDATLLP